MYAYASASDAPPAVREQHQRFGGALVIAERNQRFACLGQLGLACFLCDDERRSVREEQPRAFGVVPRPQVERRSVRPRRGLERVQRHRSISSFPKNDASPLRKVVDRKAAGTGELERRRVVMRERFGVVCGPSQGLDPLRGSLMLGDTLGARDLPVRHFAHQ